MTLGASAGSACERRASGAVSPRLRLPTVTATAVSPAADIRTTTSPGPHEPLVQLAHVRLTRNTGLIEGGCVRSEYENALRHNAPSSGPSTTRPLCVGRVRDEPRTKSAGSASMSDTHYTEHALLISFAIE